jgi:5-methylcytosine-specific restriction endonuclease McrA
METKNKKKWDAARDRYYRSEDWEWVREQVNKRDKRCVKCKRPYRVGDVLWNVHHTCYGNFGSADLWEVEDCELLCQPCHHRVHGLPVLSTLDDELDKIVGWVE